MPKLRPLALIAIGALIALDGFVWWHIAYPRAPQGAEIYFLDVGQGDSGLVSLPGGVQILIDAGPDRSAAKELEGILPVTDSYIDMVVITHPQMDHFGGLSAVLGRYDVGMVVTNGRSADGGKAGEAWDGLLRIIGEKKIPLVVLGAGDAVRYRDTLISVLSPDSALAGSAELNDTGIVLLAATPSWRALFTADIGMQVEQYLLERADLRADILKVGHHGSKYSSGEDFLGAVRPRLALIGAGRGNTYGHPTPETLGRLAAEGIRVLRTDIHGTMRIQERNGTLAVFAGAEK